MGIVIILSLTLILFIILIINDTDTNYDPIESPDNSPFNSRENKLRKARDYNYKNNKHSYNGDSSGDSDDDILIYKLKDGRRPISIKKTEFSKKAKYEEHCMIKCIKYNLKKK